MTVILTPANSFAEIERETATQREFEQNGFPFPYDIIADHMDWSIDGVTLVQDIIHSDTELERHERGALSTLFTERYVAGVKLALRSEVEVHAPVLGVSIQHVEYKQERPAPGKIMHDNLAEWVAQGLTAEEMLDEVEAQHGLKIADTTRRTLGAWAIEEARKHIIDNQQGKEK